MSKKDKTKGTTKSKIKHDIRLPYSKCMNMTFREIKKSKEYAVLTPLGIYHPSRAYHEGHKSTMRKKALCDALNDPKKYHKLNKRLKDQNKPYGDRVRATRKGLCLIKSRKLPCTGEYKYKGLTSTDQECCYKRKPMKKGKTKGKTMTKKNTTKRNNK